jgi:hypothetical protein
MGLLKRLLYKKNGTPTLVGKPVNRVIRPKRKEYVGYCLLKFDGEPIRKFETKTLAYSSKQADKKMTQGLSVHVVKVVKKKRR